MAELENADVQKGKKGIVKKYFKSFVDVKSWSSYDELSTYTKNAVGFYRRLFKRDSREIRNETYDEAIARLGLSDEQVISKKNTFLHSALVYAFFAVGFFAYLIYLLVHMRWLASFLCLVLLVLMSLSAYREHFWYMQMQKKKLGCSFNEWMSFVLGRK